MSKPDRLALLLLVAVWAAVVALVGLGGDYALNDDWAYAYSARHLLQTGHLRLLDWGAPSLATHALWGAGAMALLGDSYVALRCGTLTFGLAAILCLYGLARAVLDPRPSVIVALALGLSPWFVNLSFTYMTDVPWLAMMLAALLVFVHGFPPGPPGSASAPASPATPAPRPLLLLASGTLVGIAALTRQFAVITVPAFAAAIAFDARARHGAGWARPAARSFLIFCAPVVALFGPYQYWYSHVHGATQANRETVARILEVRPWHVAVHVFCILHYAGFWLFPLAAALLFRRRIGEVVTRRQAIVAISVLGAYAVLRPIIGPYLHPRGPSYVDGPGDNFHPFMPYLGNVFYLIGLGPPTLTEVYRHNAPWPHHGVWFGVLLTAASTFGGVVGAGLIAKAVARVRRAWAQPGPTEDEGARPRMVRLLLAGLAACYLLFHLCTSTLIFDRYLLPVLPVVFLLAIDAAPRDLARSPVIAGCFVLSGILSAAGTHEYLSWNGARDRAFRALLARGVPADQIDGGFEENGPLHFEQYLRRTGKLINDDSYFWVENARYRIGVWPSREPGCVTRERYPYWTWPGGGDQAIYVLECGAASSK